VDRLQLARSRPAGNLIGESVFARCLSALKEERVEASKILEGPAAKPT
jgi:6-phosphogluconate dehydrogenase